MAEFHNLSEYREKKGVTGGEPEGIDWLVVLTTVSYIAFGVYILINFWLQILIATLVLTAVVIIFIAQAHKEALQDDIGCLKLAADRKVLPLRPPIRTTPPSSNPPRVNGEVITFHKRS